MLNPFICAAATDIQNLIILYASRTSPTTSGSVEFTMYRCQSSQFADIVILAQKYTNDSHSTVSELADTAFKVAADSKTSQFLIFELQVYFR